MKPSVTTEQKIVRARTQLLLRQPFFGTLCLRLKMISAPVPTMATDGRRILYGPAFVESLTPAELEGVLAHEVMHCALAHHCRRGNRDRRGWNEAADYATNPILLKNNFVLPQGALVDPAYDGLSAEDIYAQLIKNSDAGAGQSSNSQAGSGGQGQQGGSAASSSTPAQSSNAPGTGRSGMPVEGSYGPGGIGEVLDATDDQGDPVSPAEIVRLQHEWGIAAEQAVRMAKACGHEPASVERALTAVRESRQAWREILRDFVASTNASDYRWSPPNRRHIAAGLYLPSIHRSGVGPIVIAVDTSGSIGDEELAQFAGEISSIADDAQPEVIHVVYCDAAVQSSQDFKAGDTIQLEPKGGGGTDFRPVFRWVEEQQLQPTCLIYLTDLCCYSYPPAPDYPVLWATDSRRTAPFGETLHICAE